MPPPGYEPFLRAICADPEDDTARLVYADWLDENGDPDRAEFIRVSIEWSRAEDSSTDWQRLRDQVVTLVKRHGQRWLDEFPQSPGVSWDMGFPWGPFYRGFPAAVAVLNRRFVEVAERIFSLAPVTHLVFPRVSVEVIRDALACPCAERIRDFTIVWSGPNLPGDELCEALAGFTHLRRLESLQLSRMGITDRGAAALAVARFLPQLREISLAGNPLSEAGVLAITDRLSPELVRRLHVSPHQLDEAAWERLRERFGATLYLS